MLFGEPVAPLDSPYQGILTWPIPRLQLLNSFLVSQLNLCRQQP